MSEVNRSFKGTTMPAKAFRVIAVTAMGVVLLFAKGTAVAASLTEDRYCGLYAVYAAALIAGIDADFDDLLHPRYLGCRDGSSIVEVARAAQDIGLQTLILNRASPDVLRATNRPVILFVRSNLGSGFDHYILFTGYRRGVYDCLDGDDTLSLSEAELLSRWGGTGIVASPEPISSTQILVGSWFKYGAIAVAILLFALGSRLSWSRASPQSAKRRRDPFNASSWAWLCTLVVIGLTFGIVLHSTWAAGLLSKHNAVAALEDAHIADFISRISAGQARKMHSMGAAVFVDARTPADFADGHIDGAWSVPLGDTTAMRLFQQGVPSEHAIIVYCQNKQCPYAAVVAAELKRSGYHRTEIFEDGWERWQ